MNFSKADVNPKEPLVQKLHGKGDILLKFPNVRKEKDYKVALNSMFENIETHKKKTQEKLIVDLNGFIEAEWCLIYSKLQSSQQLLTKIDQICFQDTPLSLAGLNDLYKLYDQFKDEKSFPKISIDLTPAERKLDKFKKEASTNKHKNFLEKIVFDITESQENSDGTDDDEWQELKEG